MGGEMALSRLELMRRRKNLLAQISVQRGQIADLVVQLQPALHRIDQAWLAALFVRTHAVLLLGVTGLLVVRKNGLYRLTKTVWRAWKTYRYLYGYYNKFKINAK